MKNIKIMVILTTTIMFVTNCTKQSNCDCGLTGTFIYVNEKENYKSRVYAIFVPDDGYSGTSYKIIKGYIPLKFKKKGFPIKVKACLQNIPSPYTHEITRDYKLKCIEMVE